MEKTLQQQYTLIREGKGNKDHFLKSARRVFPEFITPNTDYNTAVHILKGKSILNEGVGGIATLNPIKPDWFKIFDTNLKEAVGVKDTKEYGDQNSFEKIDKETEETLNHQFDNKNEKNIDNVYGQSFLMGYYTEMKDPKNEGKTVDELKAIVLKNMVKDINYYHKEASFGVKGIGYTSEAPGAGIPKEPKGKFKSSGYGDMPKVVKENKETRSVGSMVKPSGNEFKVGDTVIFKGTKQKVTRIVDDRIYIKSEKYGLRPETWVKAQDLKKAKTNEALDESKMDMVKKKLDALGVKYEMSKTDKVRPFKVIYKPINKSDEFYDKFEDIVDLYNLKGVVKSSMNEAKRPNLSSEIKEIEKTNEALALEAKMKSIDEAIEKRKSKLSLAESEELAELVNPDMVKTLQKEIKELEKYKSKVSKMYEKMTGASKKEVIDEASPLINEDINFFDYESWKDSFSDNIIFKELGRGVNAIEGDEIVGWWDDSQEKGVNFF
jgi:hypothetical protein